MSKIKHVKGRQVFDSRGNPTVEAEVILQDGSVGTSIVPSGASTGRHEAHELRDKNKDYLNKSVFDAVNNINNKISPELEGLKFFLPIQFVPEGREKPIGTADGIQQALDQFPNLLNERFTVCNADNLYSIKVLKLLLNHEASFHSIIAYDRLYLKFPEDRITKFALIKIDEEGFLKEIVEKPPIETHEYFRSSSNQLLVSMNIFSFSGSEIYPYLKNCIMNLDRNEKELPEAVRSLIKNKTRSVFTYIVKEHLKDLTSAHDINDF